MERRTLLVILALLMVSLVAIGCLRVTIKPEDPPPQGPYPAPPIEWGRILEGPSLEKAWSVQQTACGGFIIAGWTEPFGTGEGDFGDFWLVKTDPQGNEEWSQAFGGPETDRACSVQQTTEGGFIIAGWTESFGAGRGDFWLVKTDPQGNKEWSQTFGGPESDKAYSVQQIACGGFIIAGLTRSFGAEKSDFWLVKTDPQGNKEWSRTFGGPHWDSAYSVQQTACGGFIIAGWTESFGAGEADFWLIKTDPQGDKEWSQTFGGPAWDEAFSVQQTADGGFVIAGYVTTARVSRARPMGVMPAAVPHGCIWVVKTDAYGNLQWTQTVGTLGDWDIARSVKQTACGGFIIAGTTHYYPPLQRDFWLIKLAPEMRQ